jgi:hypothetical protein
MNIAETPFFELSDGPFTGSAELRRVGEARAVVVGEVVHGLHNGHRARGAAAATETATTAAELGGLELVNHVQVDPLHWLLGDEQHGNKQEKQCEDKCLSGHKG